MPFNPDMLVLLELCAGWRESCSVLDGGCGKAETSRWLARRGCRVVGVDLNLALPPNDFIEITDVRPGTLMLVKGDLNEVNFDAPFHAVALFGVLHYAGSPEKVEALLRRFDGWLLSKGLALLTWITDDIPHDDPSVYLPPKASVVGIMRTLNYSPLQYWEKTVEHSHGGDAHRHCIAYSAWVKGGAEPPG